MSTNFGVCNSECGCAVVDSWQDKFGCSACEKVFHLKCVDCSKTRSKKDWKRNGCRIPSGNSSVKSSSDETGLTREFIVSVMEDFKKQLSTDMNNFRKEIEELTTSLQMLSDSVDKSSSLIKEIKMENAAIKKENEELRATSQMLSGNVVELQDRIRTLEQYARRNNVEVSLIPTTPEESIKYIIKDVGKVLGVELQEGEINAAHRVPSFHERPVW